ncbi:Ferric reduction oxidase 2 [Linum grandiflorum]
MLPTKTYKYTWQPKLSSRLSSPYFGTQVLICIYLHLGKYIIPSSYNKLHNHHQQQQPAGKSGDGGGEKRMLGTWRKPMVVKGPLGIVTGIELTFLIMLVVLLVWSLYNYFNNSFKYITPATSGFEKVWEVKLDLGGLWLGLVGNICLTLLFFPVARGSSVLPFFGLTSEGSIKYHIWLGHTVMIFFTSHGICYIVHWAITHQLSKQAQKWTDITGISNVAGEISLAAGLVFYLRFLQSRKNVRLVSSRILPSQTLELNFSKSPELKYNPTSVMFLNVPSISKLQWHPFTVTSNSNFESDKLSVVIKGEGSWTTKLYQMVSNPNVDRLDVSVEGPYGPLSTHFLRHETLVLVSGGSGITPFISILRELMHVSSNLQLKTPQVTLISSFKNSNDLTMLNLLLPLTTTNSPASNLRLTIQAYITREKQPPPTTPNLIENVQSKWFNPSPTDSPISQPLSPNNWLCLAAIVASSFVAFLAVIALITRYYIYPKGKKSTQGFPVTLTDLIYMLVLCGCIVVAASLVVLWNKKDQTVVQVRNVDTGTSPAAEGLPATVVDDGGAGSEMRELESLPMGSILDVTTLHYGARPNLKSKLSYSTKRKYGCRNSIKRLLILGH